MKKTTTTTIPILYQSKKELTRLYSQPNTQSSKMTQEIYDCCIIKKNRIHLVLILLNTHIHSLIASILRRINIHRFAMELAKKKKSKLNVANQATITDDMIRKRLFDLTTYRIWLWLLPFINNEWMGHKYKREKSRLKIVLCLHKCSVQRKISHKCYQLFFCSQIARFFCLCLGLYTQCVLHTLHVVICLVVMRLQYGTMSAIFHCPHINCRRKIYKKITNNNQTTSTE